MAATTLVRVPAGSDCTAISMLELHLMATARAPHSSAADNEDALQEIARNYHDLSVLTHQRWRLKANPILPFHLAALEIMQLALDRGDAVVD